MLQDATTDLGLPFLQPAQALKHITHNEALIQLDRIVQMRVDGRLASLPPDPGDGARYILSGDPNGRIAFEEQGAWVYLTPKPGWLCWDASEGVMLAYTEAGWDAIGGEPTGAQTFGVNASADAVNRLAVASDATLLTHDGGGHQLKINRNAPADTASILFQTEFQTTAEIGCVEGGGLSLKTAGPNEPLGEAMAVGTDGQVAFAKGLDTDRIPERLPFMGGPDEICGPPNVCTVATERSASALVAGRVYASVFFADRPVELLGTRTALHVACDPGSVIRAGLYRVGGPSGSSWQMGERIHDYGTQAADTAGHREFRSSAPIMLERGWYALILGTDGNSGGVRVVHWATPGQFSYGAYATGTAADHRVGGMVHQLFSSAQTPAIQSGFPQNWPGNFSDLSTPTPITLIMALPIWKLA